MASQNVFAAPLTAYASPEAVALVGADFLVIAELALEDGTQGVPGVTPAEAVRFAEVALAAFAPRGVIRPQEFAYMAPSARLALVEIIADNARMIAEGDFRMETLANVWEQTAKIAFA